MCDSMIMVDGKPIGPENLKDRFTAIRDLIRELAPCEPDPEIEKGIGFLMMAYVTLQRALSQSGTGFQPVDKSRGQQ